MNILGISGFEGSMHFKRAHWSDLSEREYRIVQGLDSAAALFIDGELVAAAAEERFSRRKHTGAFPEGSISYCLQEAGLSLDAIDEVVHGFNYYPHRIAYSLNPISARLYRQVLAPEIVAAQIQQRLDGFPSQRVRHVDHHLAHAASAYFCSGWEECLVLVIDGMGESESASVYRAYGGKLQKLARISALDSIGILYSVVTLHLGFDFNADEYKIMGLAPYGDPKRFRPLFEQAVQLNEDGTISVPLLRINKSQFERETYSATRQFLEDHLVKARSPEDVITDDHRDAAAALQHCLDQVMLHICTSFGQKTGLRRLALAGGVALNCTANGRLVRCGAFDEVFVQPAAGDDGSALGAAAFRAAVQGEIRNGRIPAPFFGPAYGTSRVARAIEQFSDQIEYTEFRNLPETCDEAARLIAAGCVIGWYRGRMEFGPRALGHRSILANPAHPDMRNRINAMVKMREAFRPFAPAVTVREASQWFDVASGAELPYMITTVEVREQYRSELPAITHVDGSARLQTVSTDDNYAFHTLLEAVGRATGREMVLNTSYNVKGQPIVNTPEQALETFLNCGIDYLFLENSLVRRKHGRSEDRGVYTQAPDRVQLERLRDV
jgi:carbamoyltransferase